MSRSPRQAKIIFLGTLCVLLALVLTSCGSAIVTPLNGGTPTSTPVAPAIKFPLALPPATPLVCPQQTANATDSASNFVQENSTHFLYQGKTLTFSGFTFYPSTLGGSAAWQSTTFPDYINRVLDTAQQLGQNMIRTSDFWDTHTRYNPQAEQTVWHNVDYLVCAAAQRGMFVELDISAYEWFLMSQHDNAFNANTWLAYLAAVGNRYRNQSAIAFYYILGEPTVPTTVSAMHALVDFYRTTTNALHQADSGHHLIIAGGFNHMEDETAQLQWWQQIYSLPNNNIVAFKTYSQADLNLIPTIAAFARQIGKPLLDEEFGMTQSLGDAVYSGIPYNGIEMSRADFFRAVYSEGEANGVSGFIFWNLGCQINSSSYDVNAGTPAVWRVVQTFAPVSPANVVQSLCQSG